MLMILGTHPVCVSGEVTPTLVVFSSASRYFQEANLYYQNRQFPEALRIYEDLLVRYGESPELRMNAGNASIQIYREETSSNRFGYLARAVRHFEIASRLKPTNEDIRHNLFFARGLSGETLEKNEKMPMLLSWLLLRPLSNTSKGFFLGFLFLLICLLLGAILRPKLLPPFLTSLSEKKMVLWSSVGLLSTLYFIIFLISIFTSAKLPDPKTAIIKEISVQARFEPATDSPAAFELREGALVKRLRVYGDWTLVEPAGFGGGIEAWVQNAELMDL
jgi:tetratricopeptide (TPR) repeat protein